MNIKKIKLDLTVKLLNGSNNTNILQKVQDSMASWNAEVGRFKGMQLAEDFGLNSNLTKRTYAMQYDNCTLSVDVVHNQRTSNQYINGFSFL